MNFKLSAQIVHYALEAGLVIGANIRIVIVIFRRQNRRGRALAHQTKQPAKAVAQIVILQNTSQSELRRVFVIIHHNAVAHCFGQRQSNFVANLTSIAQKLQRFRG